MDIISDPRLELLYDEPSRENGYFRDACVFRPEIDIPDMMSAAILYDNGVQVAYSLNTFMPIEGYHLAFNGQDGIEIRQYERQPKATPESDEILVLKNRQPPERKRITVPHARGGHFWRRPGVADDAVFTRHARPSRSEGGGSGRRHVGCVWGRGDGKRGAEFRLVSDR
jgi:hypothetical protein